MSRKKEIDNIDLRILEIIQAEATITNRELASIVGLTPGPIHVRLKNLEKYKYLIGSTYEVNWSKLGFKYQSNVVAAVYAEETQEFEDYVLAMDGILNGFELKRDSKIPSKLKYYSFTCIFKNEAAFIEAWSGIIAKAKFPIDFQVWEKGRRITPSNSIRVKLGESF